ncbi:unnamed protein product [Arctia plantaginis]|uniref:snRNA-activating protein complex subunit 3 n=1 Tax=Arctia plantaginis TaxID=874455 RepID=A0A8S1AT77_ARCPL|nr:unnamed protein product [Arctia plantaginis]
MFKNFSWSENSNADSILQGLSYNEIEFTGRQYVSDVMEHFVCEKQTQNQKGIPNGFLFIKDVFYVDKNQRSTVHVDSIRSCVEAHELGTFSKKDMRTCRLDELDFNLGQSDLYIHSTSCEHIIVFSQVRLLDRQDPNRMSDYPRKISSTEFNRETEVICFNCRAFRPQWIVSACARIQFHIGLYCDCCYKDILFDKNDQPLCKFQSLPYPEITVTNN